MTLWTRMPELGNQTQGLVGNCRPGGKKNVSVSRVCFVYHKTNYIDCSTWVFNKRFVIMRSIRKEKRVARQVPHARFDSDDEDVVVLDGEEEWLESKQKSQTSILQQAFAASGLVIDRLTEIALNFAPEDVSYSVVRTAVSGGLALIALSFVKGVLSFFLTIGTLLLGAYVAVRIFGIEEVPAGIGDMRTAQKKKPNLNKKIKRKKKKNSGRKGRAVENSDQGFGVGRIFDIIVDAASGSDDEGLLEVRFRPKGSRKRR